MVTKKSFGIIGGDFRQIYLAKKFRNDGNRVFLYGFDKLKPLNEFLYPENIYDTITQSDYIILPIPTTRDGISINAPLSKNIISLDSNALNLLHKKIIFGDLTKFTENIDNYINFDYSKNEDFQILNAIPTAEGALKIVLENKNRTLFKSKCLIAGFGRIGKILANRLKNFNTDIAITDRNNINLAWAYALGYSPIPSDAISDNLKNYDFIFNTIPDMVFNETLLPNCNKDALIIDLASAPGGTDKKIAEKLGINHRHEQGIPGKMFPKTAANIIYYSVKKTIEEKIL